MVPDDPMAIERRLGALITSSEEPRGALAALVREFGAARTGQEARIVFASWRSRIDLVEETLEEVLAEQSS